MGQILDLEIFTENRVYYRIIMWIELLFLKKNITKIFRLRKPVVRWRYPQK
jgi:hypothetical protein